MTTPAGPESEPTTHAIAPEQPVSHGAHELDADDTDRIEVADLIAQLGRPADEPAQEIDTQEPDTQEPAEQVAGQPLPDPPAVLVTGLTLTTKSGPVFAGVDLRVDPGTVAAVVGPQGSGRTCFLLAVAGRMAYTSGAVAVAGIHAPKQVRQQVALARIANVVDLEDTLTVTESVTERCLIDDVRVPAGRRRFAEAARLLGLGARPGTLVEQLTAPDRVRLAVALACVRPAHLVVLDDLDRDCSTLEQAQLLRELSALAAEGPAVLVSTVDPEPVGALALTAAHLERLPETSAR